MALFQHAGAMRTRAAVELMVYLLVFTAVLRCAVMLQARHPLMCELMSCFAALLKEYKGEVEDILVADKQVRHGLLLEALYRWQGLPGCKHEVVTEQRLQQWLSGAGAYSRHTLCSCNRRQSSNRSLAAVRWHAIC